MEENIQEVKSGEIPQKTAEQITLPDLIQMAQPLIKSYTQSQLEHQKQELEYNLRAIQIQAKQNKVLIWGFFFVSLIVLGIALYLYIQNRDSAATNLIQLMVALGGAAFGSYGWAIRKKSLRDEHS